jgi:hypothetical protein
MDGSCSCDPGWQGITDFPKIPYVYSLLSNV